MKLSEMKKKVLALIEELSPDNPLLTEDPDISTKINHVINQIMYELARMKKIPLYVEMDVQEGDIVDFDTIATECGKEVYQLSNVSGVLFTYKADGTVMKIRESGTLEIECYVYPERITDDDEYDFELPQDVLEVMPYGVAADLLKSDVSTEYGAIYATRYETMIQRLDTRYQTESITIEGGVNW